MKNKNNAGLPDEVYVPFVESLYSNRGVLVFGFLAQALVAYAIWESTGNLVFQIFVVLFLMTGLFRVVDSWLFDRAMIGKNAVHLSRKWEYRYLVGVLLLAIQIGALTYTSILSRDNFAEFASMTLTMATMVTVVGKNFALSRIVHLFSFFVFSPIFLALVQIGGWKHYAGAALLVPFFMSVRSMSRFLQIGRASCRERV